MQSSNEPEGHHYLPEFYLARWKGAKGDLVRFAATPRGEVRYKYVSPKAAGFATRLYETPGVEPSEAQALETQFLQQLDSCAAAALQILLREKDQTPGQSWRSDWSRFLLSLLYRTPSNLGTAKAAVAAMWADGRDERELRYQEIRKDVGYNEAPETLEQYISENDPHLVEKIALDIAARGMQSPTVGVILNNLSWVVVGPAATSPSLLTSDEPIRMTEGIGQPEGYLTMPLSPERLFVATHERSFLEKLLQHGPTELFIQSNLHVVEQARSQVIAINLDHQAFVVERFGRGQRPNLVSLIAEAVEKGSRSTASNPDDFFSDPLTH